MQTALEHSYNDEGENAMSKNRLYSTLALALFLVSFILLGCSKGPDAEKEVGNAAPAVSLQAKEAVGDYSKKSLDRAHAAQTMGEDRTNAVDQVLKS